MIRKPFEKDEYDACDRLAKEVVAAYLRKLGHEVEIRPEEFGIDLRSILDGKEYFHEPEVKRVWVGGWSVFWDTVHLPERKGHFFFDGVPNVFYWVLKADYTQAWYFPGKVLLRAKLEEVRNKKIASGEQFYKISLKEPLLHTAEIEKVLGPARLAEILKTA